MFGLIRLILGCFLFLFLVCIVKRTKLVARRAYYIVCVLISVIFVSVLAFIPLENNIFTFDTPEGAYHYYNFGKSDVKLVVSGKYSDLVIGDKYNSDVYLIVPKAKDGWKIGLGADTKKITQKVVDGIVVYVYQYKDTNDYFVTVLNTNGGALEIKDSCNSYFFNLVHKKNSTNDSFVSYHASIISLDKDYWLYINGNIISVL